MMFLERVVLILNRYIYVDDLLIEKGISPDFHSWAVSLLDVPRECVRRRRGFITEIQDDHARKITPVLVLHVKNNAFKAFPILATKDGDFADLQTYRVSARYRALFDLF